MKRERTILNVPVTPEMKAEVQRLADRWLVSKAEVVRVAIQRQTDMTLTKNPKQEINT
jgi:hypothetical protein